MAATPGLAIRATRATVVVVAAAAFEVDLALALLQAFAGFAIRRQPWLASLDLGWQVQLRLWGFGFVGGPGTRRQRVDPRLEIRLGPSFMADGRSRPPVPAGQLRLTIR